MNLRSDLGRVRGLGSAKEGTSHWWMQRVTAVGLVPLTLWFAWSVASLSGTDQAGFAGWLSKMHNLTLFILFVGALFYHMKLGLQVVIEDYVHDEKMKVVGLLLNIFVAVLFGLSAVIALLNIAFGG